MSENQTPKFKTPEEVDAYFDKLVNEAEYWLKHKIFDAQKDFAEKLQRLATERSNAKMTLNDTSKYEVVFEDDGYRIKEKVE